MSWLITCLHISCLFRFICVLVMDWLITCLHGRVVCLGSILCTCNRLLEYLLTHESCLLGLSYISHLFFSFFPFPSYLSFTSFLLGLTSISLFPYSLFLHISFTSLLLRFSYIPHLFFPSVLLPSNLSLTSFLLGSICIPHRSSHSISSLFPSPPSSFTLISDGVRVFE